MEVRDTARRLLPHYPGVQYIEVAHKDLPEVFGPVVQRQAEVTGAPQPVLDLSFCHSVMTSITNSALQLRRADDALIAGNFEASRGIAIEALANAEGFKDLLAEAKALCILADRDRLASKYRRAHDSSQRAALLFRLVGDVEGEVAALTILSHVAANLGRSEDAIEAALLSARLVERMPPGLQRVAAYNYLGVAYLWSRNWELTRQALDAAIQTSDENHLEAGTAWPRLNQCLADMFRYTEEHSESGSVHQIQALREIAGRLSQIAEGKVGRALSVSYQDTLEYMSRMALVIISSWLGETDKAGYLLEAAEKFLDSGPIKTWLNVFHSWARTELAWKSGDFASAENAAAEMVQVATDVEHEQLACVGQLLVVQIAEVQGKHVQALEALRSLRKREQMIRAEAVQSRERAVQWQLEAEKLKRQATEHGQEMVEANVKVLQAQIEPHFLFNTLASVQHLVRNDTDTADFLLTQLIRFLRESMPLIRGKGSTLGREFGLAQAYLNIAQVRMGGRLEVKVDLPSNLVDEAFPTLIIQTLVENAIKHGIEPKTGPVSISVNAQEIAKGGKNYIEISVTDTGVGFGGANTKGTGVGLRNIRERLAGIYGETSRLEICSVNPTGVCAKLRIPQVS